MHTGVVSPRHPDVTKLSRGSHDDDKAGSYQGLVNDRLPASGWVAGMVLVLSACAEPSSPAITIRGSDTMVVLAQRWAEHDEGVSSRVVQVSGGGTGTGIVALADGTCDIATASRRMEDGERARIEQQRRAAVHEHIVAIDAITLYVHRDNPIAALSLEQASAIFRGKIKHWHEVDPTLPTTLGPIVLYGRESASGTYAFFKAVVLHHLDFARETQTLPGTAAVVAAVGHDERGIGYGGVASGSRVRRVPIRIHSAVVPPESRFAVAGTYPLARPLYLYTVGTPTPDVEAFLDFVAGPTGQALVEDTGFFPTRAP
jgi:phosphate transport system substrate-binding protein